MWRPDEGYMYCHKDTSVPSNPKYFKIAPKTILLLLLILSMYISSLLHKNHLKIHISTKD